MAITSIGYPITYKVEETTYSGHTARDFGIVVGTPILSCYTASVIYVGWQNAAIQSGIGSGAGYFISTYVEVDGDKYVIEYCHLTEGSELVSVGGTATKGVQIASSGNTGYSTGPHLHLQIKKNGVLIDPLPLLETPSGGISEAATTTADATTGTTNTATDVDVEDEELEEVSFKETFEQMQLNIAALELGETISNWGDKSDVSEESDWISFKQFLLYLATRYCPQSIYPFLELIPAIELSLAEEAAVVKEKTSDETTTTSDGTVGKKAVSKVGMTTSKALVKYAKSRLADKSQLTISEANNNENAPGFNEDRWIRTKSVMTSANLNTDLFRLDPFKEGMTDMTTMSDMGKEIYETRGVGVRVYGQLVLNPELPASSVSKPGAIGFTEFEIQAGNQSTDGLALISMTLVDVQGNKFTDINSPWAFIYDARPGSLAGDFYFRYGWQIRFPDFFDTSPTSTMFWSHPGWTKFGDTIKRFFISNILPSRPYVTLTQNFPTGESWEASAEDRKLYALFDEGVTYDADTGAISIVAPDIGNYIQLSILNPEITMDANGALHAKLNFRTTGSIVTNVPLTYAITTKALITSAGFVKLGDLLLTIMYDMATYGYQALSTDNDKLKQIQLLNKYSTLNSSRDFSGLVYISGLENGGFTGGIHPDEVYVKITNEKSKMLTNGTDEEDMTILAWFRGVLEDSNCELLSAATGSGAGINAAWVITCSSKDAEDGETLKYTKNLNYPKPEYKRLIDQSNWDIFRGIASAWETNWAFSNASELLSWQEKRDEMTALKVSALKNEIARQEREKKQALLDKIKDDTADIYTEALAEMAAQLDVFSYRFQGTLCESINVEKTEATNALKIALDYSVSDFATYDSEAEDVASIIKAHRKVTAADRQRNLKIIFSQLQNCTITAMAHPWMGPGKPFYIKGMGFFDGKYLCLSITHKMSENKFVSEIKGARILLPSKKEEAEEAIDLDTECQNIADQLNAINLYNNNQLNGSTTFVSSIMGVLDVFGIKPFASTYTAAEIKAAVQAPSYEEYITAQVAAGVDETTARSEMPQEAYSYLQKIKL